jgi:hypothetical protein
MPQQRLLAALLELLLQHSLDNLLLLDQESTNDAGLHAVCAAGAAVSAGDGLLALLSNLRLSTRQVLQLLLPQSINPRANQQNNTSSKRENESKPSQTKQSE